MSHTIGPLETLLRLKANEYMWDLFFTLLICKFLMISLESSLLPLIRYNKHNVIHSMNQCDKEKEVKILMN